MKQRSSSFQISDILGLPQKENSSGDDSTSHPSHTTIPPASISSALHSSNNHYMPFNASSYPLPPNTTPPKSPTTRTGPNISVGGAPYTFVVNQQTPPPPAPAPPSPTSNPINATPIGHNYPPLAPQTLIDSKHLTGGYLPGSLNSSMFLESSAAAAAHHYNNLFHGRNWHLDNSNDHYGECRDYKNRSLTSICGNALFLKMIQLNDNHRKLVFSWTI